LLFGQSPIEKSKPGPFDVSHAVVELIALGPGEDEKNRECQATGFLVNEVGYILTSAHVVDEARDCLAGASLHRILAKPVTAEPTAAGAVSCDVVSVDELHDLALLRAQRSLFRNASESGATTVNAKIRNRYLHLDPAAVEDATEVAVTGHPAFAWHSETQSGRVVGYGSMALSDVNAEKSDVLFVDIPLLKGASGSPVYRMSDGSVVGIVERKDLQHPGRTVAVPVRYAIEMLDRAGVKWHAPIK
jgi:S1-C subfamily serine protease